MRQPIVFPPAHALWQSAAMKPFPYAAFARALENPGFTPFDYIVFVNLTITFFLTWRILWRIACFLAIFCSRLLIALVLATFLQGVLFITGPYQTVRKFGGSFGGGGRGGNFSASNEL